MKKIIGILLVAILLIGSINCVFAQNETRISISAINDHIQVTVNTNETTDCLILKVQSADDTVFVYAKEKNAPDGQNPDGSYKYSFDFYVGYNIISGHYKAIVGGLSEIKTEPFKIVLSRDKVAFYNNLETKQASEIPLYFQNNEFYLPGTYAEFANILPELSAIICSEIVSMNLAVLNDESNLTEVDSTFTTLYKNRVLCANVVQETDTAKWNRYVLELAEGGKLFTNYYSQLDSVNVHSYFSVEKEITVAEANVIKAIDKAVLLSIADKINASILRDAIGDYSTKNVFVSTDLSDYNSLDDNNKLLVCEAIKDAEPATFEALVSALKAKASELKTTDTTNTPQGGGATLGGGGGGGGGATIGKETVTTEKQETTETKPLVAAFNDISNVSWAETAIKALAEKGVLSGKEANKFYPNDNVTREEFVKIIIEAFGLKDTNANVDFSDVDASKWSYIYIASAKSAGIVSGKDNGSFGASDNITRQDMAVILARTLKLAGFDMSASVIDFADANNIADYAKTSVASLLKMGIVNGMGDGTYSPVTAVTRAQAAKVVYEALSCLDKR